MQAHLAKRFKGLEPLIAAIILIAVTLVIAIAVVAWMLGVFGTTTAGGERLRILPNATLNVSANPWKLNLTIVNEGGGAAKIIEIKVGDYSCSPIEPDTINPGETKLIKCDLGSISIPAGVTYTVRVMTAAGNLYTTVVVASEEAEEAEE